MIRCLLIFQLLPLIALRDPPLEHIQGGQQGQIEKQGEKQVPGRCVKDITLCQEGVDIVALALVHQAEIIADGPIPVPGVEQMIPGALLHDPLQDPCILNIRDDQGRIIGCRSLGKI